MGDNNELTDAEKARAIDSNGLPLYEMTPDGWQLHSLRSYQVDPDRFRIELSRPVLPLPDRSTQQ